MFNDLCTQNSLEDSEKPKASSTMLSQRALPYYFDHLQGKRLNLDSISAVMWKRFLTEEHMRVLLLEWDSISLQSVMSENGVNKANECHILLIACLEDIQSVLPKDYQQ